MQGKWVLLWLLTLRRIDRIEREDLLGTLPTRLALSQPGTVPRLQGEISQRLSSQITTSCDLCPTSTELNEQRHMSQLTEAQFSQALADFVVKFNAISQEKWTLHKGNGTICAKQSVMIKVDEKLVNRQVYITYNPVYKVPVLWFNLYNRDGCPLDAHQTLGLVKGDSGLDLAKNISLNEHPVLGVLFYNIHPCKTSDIMEELPGEGNYISKWLSVYGQPIGVDVPPTLLATTTGASSPLSTETSRSSEDGSF